VGDFLVSEVILAHLMVQISPISFRDFLFASTGLSGKNGRKKCHDPIYVRILLFLAIFSPVLFENAARKFYARNTVRRFSCTPALQADAEKFLEKLSDRKTNYIVRIHNAQRVLPQQPSGLGASFLVFEIGGGLSNPLPKQAGALNGPAKPLEPHAHLAAPSVGRTLFTPLLRGRKKKLRN
jgi:hypothetical protein